MYIYIFKLLFKRKSNKIDFEMFFSCILFKIRNKIIVN